MNESQLKVKIAREREKSGKTVLYWELKRQLAELRKEKNRERDRHTL